MQSIEKLLNHLENMDEEGFIINVLDKTDENKRITESNESYEDYIKKVLDEMFEEEEFDDYDKERVVKEVIQYMKQDGILTGKITKELKQLIRDLFDERLEKDLLSEKKKLNEGAGHNPDAWIVDLYDAIGLGDEEEPDSTEYSILLEELLEQLDFKSLDFNDNIEGTEEQVISHRTGLVQLKMQYGYNGDTLEFILRPNDVGNFIDITESTRDENMLDFFKKLPSGNEIIENIKAKYNEEDDFEALDDINSTNINWDKLEKEFDEATKPLINNLRANVQNELKNVFLNSVRIATGPWTSEEV